MRSLMQRNCSLHSTVGFRESDQMPAGSYTIVEITTVTTTTNKTTKMVTITKNRKAEAQEIGGFLAQCLYFSEKELLGRPPGRQNRNTYFLFLKYSYFVSPFVVLFSSRGIENEFLLASSRHPKKNVPGTKIPVFVPRVRKREFSYLV